MSDDERALMQQHAAYMKTCFDAGSVLAYGPVLDPEGSFGIALLDTGSLEEARQMGEDDPTVRAGMTRCTVAPMHIAASQPSRAKQ